MKNRRQYSRYETEFEARIYAKDFCFSATVIDISKGGSGILSENPIELDNYIGIVYNNRQIIDKSKGQIR